MPCVDTPSASSPSTRLQVVRHPGRHLGRQLGHLPRLASLSALLWGLSACTTPEPPTAPPTPAPKAAQSDAPREPAKATGDRPVRLGAPKTPRSWSEARHQAAQRLVAANPDGSYMGKPPFMLLAIPVMTVELNADGSVRHISVMRKPSQAHDTVDLAIKAIHRAAPFGDVSKLPKPWKFNETFLFKADRKFKPMTLDQPGA